MSVFYIIKLVVVLLSVAHNNVEAAFSADFIYPGTVNIGRLQKKIDDRIRYCNKLWQQRQKEDATFNQKIFPLWEAMVQFITEHYGEGTCREVASNLYQERFIDARDQMKNLQNHLSNFEILTALKNQNYYWNIEISAVLKDQHYYLNFVKEELKKWEGFFWQDYCEASFQMYNMNNFFLDQTEEMRHQTEGMRRLYKELCDTGVVINPQFFTNNR